jgi:hypothetical protein
VAGVGLAGLAGAKSHLFPALFSFDYSYQSFAKTGSGQTQGNLKKPCPFSQSLGSSAQLFAGQLGKGGYSGPLAFDKTSDLQNPLPRGQIQDNPSRHDYNMDETIDNIINIGV